MDTISVYHHWSAQNIRKVDMIGRLDVYYLAVISVLCQPFVCVCLLQAYPHTADYSLPIQPYA